MLSEVLQRNAKHEARLSNLWSIPWGRLPEGDPRFFASLRMTSLMNYQSQPACRPLLRSSVQIALQNHLRRYLIQVAAGLPRFLPGVTQCPVGCSGREPLVPGDDR